MISTNTVCFEGICRIYRNSVVDHIREMLSRKYPTEWESKLSVPFKREWEDIRKAAETRHNTGELEGRLKDDSDLLDVNHFYNLFELYFDDLFPEVLSMSTGDQRQKKQAVLSWSRNIKNLRDPVTGHPIEADVAEADAMFMLDSARRVLDSFDKASAGKIADLWEKIKSGQLTIGVQEAEDQRTLEGSILPSRESVAPRFVGRQAELELLSQWLKEPDSRVWLLAGDGGKGKTAIAYEFAVDTRDNPPAELEIVIWLSAKARRFDSGQSLDIDTPDFWDLDSALNWVLSAYGAIDFEETDVKSKEKDCLDYLSLLPALIILDDVDSLEGQNIEAMNFFLFRAQATKSKVLLTSRRVPHFGMDPITTQVRGFESGSAEGIRFIESRIGMYELESRQFPRAVINNILDACDGSPLFVQDLLKLCIVGEAPSAAISKWRSAGGEAARRYALEREFEMLSLPAKKVLLSCALYEGPASLPEIQFAAEIPEEDCRDAIRELQKLFLVPRAHLVEGIPRFSLNANTRRLVLDVLGDSDLAARISSFIKVFTGQSQATPAHRQRVRQYIRQAITQVKLDEHDDAEETLSQALDLYPESADLHGTLGWVYKSWNPHPRHTDARKQFIRAAELKCTREDTYQHWWEIERGQLEWTSAAEAAEKGLEMIGASEQLAFRAGLARSQSAKDLYQQAQYSRAEQEACKAEIHLRNAIADLDGIEPGQYQFHSRVHRAIVINYEHLVRISQYQQNPGEERHFLRLLSRSLIRWGNEHPSDAYASSERQRLLYWFPDLSSYLH